MKKQNIILLSLGLLLTVIPFFINIYSIFRLISLLMGLIILILGLIINKKHKTIKVILYPIISIALILGLDIINSGILHRIPIVSIASISSSKVKVYNSVFYRVYDCYEKLSFDLNYQDSYLCQNNYIKAQSVNKYLENPEQAYKKTKRKFVHLQGKISSIVGNSMIKLSAYEDKVELNGYVLFDEGKTVIIKELNINPAEYHVYDLIEVVGLVAKYEETEFVSTIYLEDAKVIKSDVYESYELLVNNIDSKDKIKVQDKIYYLGLQRIYYKYDANSIYELDYLISDKRVMVDDLIKDVEEQAIDDKHRLYELEEYNILICENEDLIMLNKKYKDLDDICNKDKN